MRSIKVLTLSIMLTFLFINSATAHKVLSKHIPHTGLRSIGIIISSLDDDTKKAGFTEEELINAVELKLGHNLIKLRDIQDSSNSELSFLYLKLNVMYLAENNHYIYCIDICLIQPVCHPEDDELIIAKTWDQKDIDIAPLFAIRQVVMDTIDASLDDFLNKYLFPLYLNSKK